MTIATLPMPQTTLLLLLGASEWPQFPEFQSSKAFANAAKEMKDYFLDSKRFGLLPENVFDRFNWNLTSDELDVQIGQFLEQRIAAMKATSQGARDLLIYFTGHGGFVGRDSDFYLAIRRTRMDNPRASGLSMLALADTLQEKARYLRRFIILDCCFAAAAFSAFQAGPAQIALEKTRVAFEVRQKGEGVPSRGTTLLCSSGHKSPSLLLPDGSSTMFTKAVLDVLMEGTISQQTRLSLRTVKDLAADRLSETRNAPKPVVLSPDQSEGDVADIPFFPNPCIEKERIRLAEEERRQVVETSISPQFSQTLLPTRSQALIHPSTGEGQQPKELLARLSLTKGMIRCTRLLVCWIILMAYWLFLGYMLFLWIFPKRILRISGSTNLYMFLRGDFRKTEMLKILIVFFSLTLDWFIVGTILSHFSHLTLFTVQEVWIYGPLLTAIFLCLFIGYIILYYIVKWPYTDAMNIRKTMEIIVIITLLTFISPSFGASFMYFPLFTGVIALCLFFGGLVSLGGIQHQEDSGSLNARLERRLQIQLEDERQSKEYFKNRKKQR